MVYLKSLLFILSALSVLTAILAWSPVWQHRNKLSKKNQVLILSSAMLILIATLFIKDVPIYERGQCFTVSASQDSEEWQSKEKSSLIEFVVLKVGKKHYLVHSSQARNEDFLIAKDILTRTSECQIIYKR